ncbi:MAG: DNA gyrase subunit A [Bacteroidales bacterium]|jgi:DNA gyrase subunit A|nr:DNA gyrase subunit A [Bacteroidales bacterium]
MSEEGKDSRILSVNVTDQMKSAYIDYSMSVIVSRALPDVRDGLKPVHRRILFGMSELGITGSKSYKKSARIVGEVLGKYHPHGDSSVYFAMVRMAQPWSMRYMLVDGQGNFGSVDGDSPAAMRYTEARLQKLSNEVLKDLDKETVDFQYNFDDTLKEPTVLPTVVPLLLVNGTSGIAVGMATNMPPHNLTEVVDALCATIDKPDISIDELIQYVKAPDFPTGGIIYGYEGVKEAFETGRGRIVVRSKTDIEITDNGREHIIVTEIPYLVNKAELIIKIADLINEKKIDGISNVNDESDRRGMRIVIDLKRDAVSNVVLNKLFKYTQLQTSFSVNNIALVNGRPQMLNLQDLLMHFIDHRIDVLIRRTEYELRQAEKRAHILEGLIKALEFIDEVIAIIKQSKNVDEARLGLMERFDLSLEQAKAIVEMRLRSLTALETNKLKEEHAELMEHIKYFQEILSNETLRRQIIRDELVALKEKYGDERRTDIIYASEDMNPEDYYADDEMVITISHLGYIKRTPLTEFRTQGRGGVGSRASNFRDKDFIESIFTATMHNTLIFFTAKGKCFWLKVYELPEGTKASQGRAIQNLINIEPDDEIKAYIRAKDLKDDEYIDSRFIMMATKRGVIKKTRLREYSRPRQNGINAITIREDDMLLNARLIEDVEGEGVHNIVIAAKNGKAIRFPHDIVRPIGRTATGVRGISLTADDEAIGMIVINPEKNILVVSKNGYGKRSDLEDYRITNRGGKGVKTINITEKTGELIAINAVTDMDHLMIITKQGIMIRIAVSDLRVMGRATQGVRLINLRDDDQIAAVTNVENGAEEEEETTDAEIVETDDATDESTDSLNNQSEEETDSPEEN